MKKGKWLLLVVGLSLSFGTTTVMADSVTDTTSSAVATSSQLVEEEDTLDNVLETTETNQDNQSSEEDVTTSESSTTTETSTTEDTTETSSTEDEIMVEKIKGYVTLTHNQLEVVSSLEDGKVLDASLFLNKTFVTKEKHHLSDGSVYYSLYNDKNQLEGYVNETFAKYGTNPQGKWVAYDKYISVSTQSDSFYANFNWKQKGSTKAVYRQTFKTNGIYYHVNGKKYYSVYNNKKNWLGYLDSSSAEEVASAQGNWIKGSGYATVTKKGYSIWSSFGWKEASTSQQQFGKTFRVGGYYNHYNGSTYYSLYDNNNNWLGYVNKNATETTKGAQGAWMKGSGYATLTKKTYPVWKDFNWSKQNTSKQLLNKTYRVSGYYNHYNGSTYYSLYDNKGNWQGYINAKGVQKTSGKQGAFIKDNRYMTMTKSGYDVFQNFNWQKKSSSRNHLNTTYKIKGHYQHYNGSTYYSFYDNKDRWQGYVNKNAATIAKGPEGIWISYKKDVVVVKKGYPVWRNFQWEEKNHSNKMLNKSYKANGQYKHFNGSTYYSLYNNKGGWEGYINAKAVNSSRTVGTYLGTTREDILANLQRHQNDNYYLGTPFRGLGAGTYEDRVLSPNGRPNHFGPGMNCAGFVAVAYRDAGANIYRLKQDSNLYGGVGNAYNWKTAFVRQNLEHYKFNSVQELLNSNKAKKGDIFYFEPDFSKPGYDSHIGIFWGNNGMHNLGWHSTYNNNMSRIASGAPFTQVYLFPVD